MASKDMVKSEMIDISKMVDHFQGVIDQAMAGKMWPPVPSDPEPGFGDGDYND